MVKLKLAISILVLLQIFNFPQISKSSPVEVTDNATLILGQEDFEHPVEDVGIFETETPVISNLRPDEILNIVYQQPIPTQPIKSDFNSKPELGNADMTRVDVLIHDIGVDLSLISRLMNKVENQDVSSETLLVSNNENETIRANTERILFQSQELNLNSHNNNKEPESETSLDSNLSGKMVSPTMTKLTSLTVTSPERDIFETENVFSQNIFKTQDQEPSHPDSDEIIRMIEYQISSQIINESGDIGRVSYDDEDLPNIDFEILYFPQTEGDLKYAENQDNVSLALSEMNPFTTGDDEIKRAIEDHILSQPEEKNINFNFNNNEEISPFATLSNSNLSDEIVPSINANTFKRSPDMENDIKLLKIHNVFDTYQPFSLDNSDSNHMYAYYKRSPSKNFVDLAKNLNKRSTTCSCSSCSKTTESGCSPEIIEKPTFIIEESPETVEKPAFKVKETSETVTKPDFIVKEVTEIVPKPNFSVKEKVETVVKPNFVVEETSEKVKKPAFKVEEQSETVVKPEFVIEETPEYIEKPEFTIEENVETVLKPKFKVETKTETVEKPSFVIKEQIHQVQKPEFVVKEKNEKVKKPEFKVEEKVEVVKKPKYQIKEEIVPVTKPNFIVESTEVVVEKPEFIVTEEVLPVQKPQYLIKETQEVVEKPEFYVTEIVETVDKPNYLVEESEQTVTKPSYHVEDEQQTVKKPQFVVKEQPEYVVKPEFVIEETTIPVVKPEYVVEEVVENVQKPSYLVKPMPCYVEKPEFVVHEVVEKINKPSFNVIEKKETVKKPSFVVEEEVQTVIKPCYSVVTCTGTPRRVAPKYSKSSHSKHYYSRRPSYHRRRSHRSQPLHKKSQIYES